MKNNLNVYLISITIFFCLILVNGCAENKITTEDIIKEESIAKEVIIEEEPKEETVREEINFEGKLCKTNADCGGDLDGGEVCIANSLYHITYKPRCDSKDAIHNAGGLMVRGSYDDFEIIATNEKREGIDPSTNFTLVCKYKKIMKKIGNC